MNILHALRRTYAAEIAALLALLLAAGCDSNGGGDPTEPTAEFTVSPADPAVGEEVTFDAGSSSGGDGEITAYAWTFLSGAGYF